MVMSSLGATEPATPSIFQDASLHGALDSHSCVPLSLSGGVHPHQVATYMLNGGKAMFALSCRNGSVLVVALAAPGSVGKENT